MFFLCYCAVVRHYGKPMLSLFSDDRNTNEVGIELFGLSKLKPNTEVEED